MLDKYAFRVTLFRKLPTETKMVIQHFNAESLPDARQAMLKAAGTRFAEKVELSLIIDKWRKGDELR